MVRKNRQPIASDFLEFLLITGVASVAVGIAPYLVVAMIPAAQAVRESQRKKRAHNTFSALRRGGFISVELRRGKTSVSLTGKGKQRVYLERLKRADNLKKRQKWDGKWRLLMYDIPSNRRAKRDALRWFIQHIGFVHLQHSVWIFPHNCRNEVNGLKDFFEFSDRECRLVEASSIGEDEHLRKKFGV